MRIAIVHEWFTVWAGSENVVEQIVACFPEADLFALIDFMPDSDRARLRGKTVTTSFIQSLPFARKHYRGFLPLMPLAVARLDVSGYDLVISSSHAVAKGVRTGPGQIHVSYVHSPMRYAWDLRDLYLQEAGLDRGIQGILAKWMLHRMRIWDARTAKGVDHFIANSKFVAARICKAYGREATVIYPPVDVESFARHDDKESYYLTASRFVSYKKIDVVVEAFAGMPDRRLLVIGDGPESAKIHAKAGPNVTFLGHRAHGDLVHHLQRARAFVFAAEEDFGILPVEAQACGTPVIAFGRGGVTESVQDKNADGATGVFFAEQTPAAIRAAVLEFESKAGGFSPAACRRNAERFSAARFRDEFRGFIRDAVARRAATRTARSRCEAQ